MSNPTTRYTRWNFPTALRDTASWPQVDPGALDEAECSRLEHHQRAARAYLAGEPLKTVCRACSVSASSLLRQLNRAVALHADGRIWGWRAFLAYARINAYRRLCAPRSGPRGLSGAFHQFLADYPELNQALIKVILDGKVPDAEQEPRGGHRELYAYFRRLCRRNGISETRYPLNTTDRGQRALRRYVFEVRQAHFGKAAARVGGRNASLRARTGTGALPHLIARRPFDLVSLDAHRLNFIGCVGVLGSDGRIIAVPIHRLVVIPLYEHSCEVVLGYRVAITKEPSALDVIEAVRNALSVWQPRTLSLPNFSYPQGAALPSGVLPEAEGLCWNALLIDNATIHCSLAVGHRLPNRLGCAVNYGPVGQWFRRPHIEALFSALERRGFSRLPNSTGTGPADPLRPDATGNAVKYSMMLEEMLDLIDVMFATFNATPRGTLDNRSPLDALSDALAGAHGIWRPRTLPPLHPSIPDLDVTEIRCTVRGNLKKGRRPYIQTHHARYTSPVLANAPELIGTPLTVHVRVESDLRAVTAFLPDGAELGVLTALGGWAQTRHDYKVRQAILNAEKEGKFVVPAGCDPIPEFLVAKRDALHTEKVQVRSKRPRISAAGTSLARALQITGAPMPTAHIPSGPVDAHLEPEDAEQPSIPAFVGAIRHKGFVKS